MVMQPMINHGPYNCGVTSIIFVPSFEACNILKKDDTEDHGSQIEMLKGHTRMLIKKDKEVVEQLELVDVLQQLGLGYQFEEEIIDVLVKVHKSMKVIITGIDENLYIIALLFRLLREHGFSVSEDIFDSFEDTEIGSFKSSLCDDTRGLISLYEASFYGIVGDKTMDGAREFTTKHLNGLIKGGNKDIQDLNLVEKIKYALKFPLNWRLSRLHCRWFIERYEKEDKMNPILLELAKLDFNMVQSIHQRELVQLQRWWNEIEICGGKLSFTRDRVVENYLAVSLWAFEPKLWRCREALAKFSSFITAIDDVYDIYGSLDELELFTDAVERWDVNTIENLPEYMKICFLALFNTATDIAYKILKDKGVDIIPYFRKMVMQQTFSLYQVIVSNYIFSIQWTVLCKSFLVEAKWHHTGYIPTLEEYLENAGTSAASHIILGIAHCVNEDVTVEALERFKSFREDLTHAPCMIMRLCNDMSTSTHELARGDVSKSLECYMNEKGVSETLARQHIWDLVRLEWKELNGQPILTSGTEKLLRSVAFNFARSAHFFYQYQDGYGKNQNGEIKDSIVSLFMEPILL